MVSLTHKAIRAVLWNFTGTLGNQLAQFAIMLVLARLLSPAEFGLVAILTVFTLIASIIVESGYGAALIRLPAATRVDESSVFYLNLALSLLIYGVLWFLALPIAHFYHEPRLVAMTRLLAVSVIFNALGLVQNCLLVKQLNFRTQNTAIILATALSGGLGIAMAWRGWGVWSLVAQSLANAFLRSVLMWLFSPWRPVWAISYASLRSMFGFGSRLLVSGLLGTLYDNLYPLLIGRLFSTATLGHYSRAQGTQRLAADSFTKILLDVAFPAYSAIQHDRALLRQAYRQSIVYASVVLLPLMLGLSAMGRPIFLALYSEKWLPAVPYFQVLCLSGALYHLHAFNLNVLKAVGRSDLYLRLTVVKLAVALAGVALALPWGMMGLVWGQVVISALCLAVNTHYSARIIHYSLRQQLGDIWPYAAMGGAAALLTHVLGGRLASLNPWGQLALMGSAHCALYLTLAFLFRVNGPFKLFRHLADHFKQRRALAHREEM